MPLYLYGSWALRRKRPSACSIPLNTKSSYKQRFGKVNFFALFLSYSNWISANEKHMPQSKTTGHNSRSKISFRWPPQLIQFVVKVFVIAIVVLARHSGILSLRSEIVIKQRKLCSIKIVQIVRLLFDCVTPHIIGNTFPCLP